MRVAVLTTGGNDREDLQRTRWVASQLPHDSTEDACYFDVADAALCGVNLTELVSAGTKRLLGECSIESRSTN